MENNKKNIHTKLAELRLKLAETGIKKTGEVSYGGKVQYTYFKTKDFIPHVLKLAKELGVSFEKKFLGDKAILSIINCDDPKDIEQVEVPTPPIPTIDYTKTNWENEAQKAIKTIGAFQSYTLRYLYIAALDLAEDDAIEANSNENNSIVNTKCNNNYTSSTASVPEVPYDCDEVASLEQKEQLRKLYKSLPQDCKHANYQQARRWFDGEYGRKMSKYEANELIKSLIRVKKELITNNKYYGTDK